jgi:hypothetical protein
MSSSLESEIGNHFIGLKRRTAEAAGNGEHRVKVGKDPLPIFPLTNMQSSATNCLYPLAMNHPVLSLNHWTSAKNRVNS